MLDASGPTTVPDATFGQAGDPAAPRHAGALDGDRAVPIRVPATTAGRRRLRGVDAFRGAVLALMLLTPPIAGESLPLLRHAAWDGLTISDLIFPAFLFTSGASLAFLLRPPVTAEVRLRLVRRVVALVVLGILYNAYGTTGADLSQVRLTGVLQLIGISGALAATVVLLTRRHDRDRPGILVGCIAALVAAYGIGLAVLPPCGQSPCSPYHRIDVTILGEAHVYQAGGAGYDPEGIVVLAAASALPLLGYLVGRLLVDRQLTTALLSRAAGAGAALVAAGVVLDVVQPINKRLHTPAFTLVAAGVATIGLVLTLAAVDRAGPSRSPARPPRAAVPFLVLGRNALVVYLAERILLQSARHTTIAGGTAEEWILSEVIPFTGAADAVAYGGLLLATVLVITSLMWLARWHIAL